LLAKTSSNAPMPAGRRRARGAHTARPTTPPVGTVESGSRRRATRRDVVPVGRARLLARPVWHESSAARSSCRPKQAGFPPASPDTLRRHRPWRPRRRAEWKGTAAVADATQREVRSRAPILHEQANARGRDAGRLRYRIARTRIERRRAHAVTRPTSSADARRRQVRGGCAGRPPPRTSHCRVAPAEAQAHGRHRACTSDPGGSRERPNEIAHPRPVHRVLNTAVGVCRPEFCPTQGLATIEGDREPIEAAERRRGTAPRHLGSATPWFCPRAACR
jgi:hypothetical protein